MNSKYSAILTILAHFSKLIMGFFIIKLIAYHLGAEGLGKLGHFMSVITIVSIIAGGGVLSGVIKYVAEYRSYPLKIVRFVSSAVSYSLIFSFFLFFFGVFFSEYIAEIVFGDKKLFHHIIVIAVAQFGIAYSNIVVGVCNGLGKNHIYAKIQIATSFFSIFICWGLVSKFEFDGAVYALITSVCLIFFPALFYSYKERLSRVIKISFPRKSDFRRLFHFTLMLLVSAIAFPLVEIVVRQHLISTSGYQEAGIWQAGVRLSSAYTSLFSVFLAYWFMPIISAEENWIKIFNAVFRMVLLVMLCYLCGALVFYMWRGFFIITLLSPDFIFLEEIVLYQLIGDFFKISSYVIGFVVVAKAATNLYISAEVIQSVLFILMVFIFESYSPGASGVMIGYAFTYFLYFVISVLLFFLYVYNLSLRKGND